MRITELHIKISQLTNIKCPGIYPNYLSLPYLICVWFFSLFTYVGQIIDEEFNIVLAQYLVETLLSLTLLSLHWIIKVLKYSIISDINIIVYLIAFLVQSPYVRFHVTHEVGHQLVSVYLYSVRFPIQSNFYHIDTSFNLKLH